MVYSKDFTTLIKDRQKVALLVAGNFIRGYTFKTFSNLRKFQSKLINHNGTVLDIGCANGFFLRCTQEWCGQKIVPYGIDIDYPLLEQAKVLFPKQMKHFILLNVNDLSTRALKKAGLPDKYDFITLGIWDNWGLKRNKEISVIKEAIKHVKREGRLILRLENANKSKNLERIERLKEAGFNLAGILKNGRRSEKVVWIEKST